MAFLHTCFTVMIITACCTDAAEIVSPDSDTVSVQQGSEVQLICHSSPEEGQIMWSYDGMPVDPESSSVDLQVSEETDEDGDTVVVNKLVLHEVSAAYNLRTYTCKPQDDILNLDADEIQLFVSTSLTINKLRLVETESSSTLELAESSDGEIQLRCIGELQSDPVWYHDDERLDEDDDDLFITVRVDRARNVKESLLSMIDDTDDLVGRYQCRDANGYQADSDVLTVTQAT